MARERVVINIEVNSDVATIEATRLALERLTNQHRDLGDEYDRHTKRIQNVTKENNKLKKDHDALGNSIRGSGKHLKDVKNRWDGFGKALFSFRKDAGAAIGSIGSLIGLVNKLSLLEIPVLAAGLAGISLLFKSGTGFINMYRAAMSSLAYVAAGVGVAVTTVLAALREFQSVGFAPQYFEGAANTTDRFVAASQAMKMFVDNATLAVVGSQSLGKAFGVLSKQAPVTGQTVAAFEGLMNIVAGQGGDLGKGAESLAEFIAKVQKGGLGAAGAEAKALGPDFQKIIKEAQKLGIKTSDEFFKAAAEGALGETFQKKYAGQLDALNSTLIGTFKQSVTRVKSFLIDIGQQFLGPARDAIAQLELIVRRTLMQLSPMLRQFGENKFINDVVRVVDMAANKLVFLMNKYLGTAPGIIQYFVGIWNKAAGLFERLQDWARQFKDAGQSLIDNFFGPLVSGIIDHFGGGINVLSELIMKNEPIIKEFSNALVGFIAAIGEYGNMLKTAFISALPMLTQFIKGMTKIFNIFTGIAKMILKFFGGMGGIGKAFAAIPVLYASLVLFSRFFKTFGSFFGKDMNIKANNVNLYGANMGGMGGMGGPGGYRNITGISPVGKINNWMQGGGGGGWIRQGLSRGFANRFKNANLGLGAGLAMGGGQMLNMYGQSIGGNAGTAVSGVGNVTSALGMSHMLGLGPTTTTALAAIPAAYASSKILTNFIQDMPGLKKGTLGKDDAVGRLGMTAAGAGAGAAAGAATGAAIGSFFFGAGAAPGAAIGAVIGTVVGGITGYVNSGKYQKEARTAAGELLKNFDEATADAFAAGDLEGLMKARADMLKAHEANMQNLADTGEYQKALGDLEQKLADFDRRMKNYSSNASLAEKYLGMSTDALNKLAESAGVDLQNNMLSLREIIELTGRSAADQARLIKAAWNEINGAMVGGILKDMQDLKEQNRLAAAVSAEAQKFLTGAQTPAAMDDLITAQLQSSVSKYGEQGGIVNAFKLLTNPEAYKPGGSLYGLSPEKQQALQARATELLNPATVLQKYVTPEMVQLLQNEFGFQGLDNKGILDLLITKLSADPKYLMNLQAAMVSGNDLAVANVNPTGITPGGGRSGTYGGGALKPTTVPQVVTNTYQVNLPNGTVLTPQVLKMIEDHWAKMQRDQTERGGAR